MTLDHDSCGSAGPPTRPAAVVASEIAHHHEANHRIANSLQLVSALLSSQRLEIADPVARSALEVSVQRIAAIASVHRQLYIGGSSEAVDLSTYLLDLVAGLQVGFQSGFGHRRLHLDVDQLLVTPDFATTLGVIVTELVINACKYAYAPDESGDVEIVFGTTPVGRFSLDVRDRGVGRVIVPAQAGLGSRIVELMSRRLGADGGYVARDVGTSFRITGPLPPV
jgi:two-component sensor histidine kinase